MYSTVNVTSIISITARDTAEFPLIQLHTHLQVIVLNIKTAFISSYVCVCVFCLFVCFLRGVGVKITIPF